MGTSDLITLFFLVAAVVIFFQLRSVLGRRTGSEKPRYEQSQARSRAETVDAATKEGNVITLPGAEKEHKAARLAAVDRVSPEGSALNNGLREIVENDAQFEPEEFLKGAQSAYEMIVMSFADGDRRTLKNLLSKEVFEGFNAAMSERESKGETVKASFVGIEKADFTEAEVEKNEARITLRIVSQMISATYSKDGELVDGDPDEIAEVRDLWTFARDMRARDPNWKLIATASE
ncbi:Tim44/TimA family putative adaptor protein [Martelella mediterranea]|uniref:Putative lipid-binding transport protein (Tim44 family) n=1 Tax=Martelella mediterranea TaxID=293089 RepID=A0A4V2V4X3_9HYPH|nr:Tim44/TimA family putative adaptor protein [Martelella mediterranea]TCT44671.1 putative lipid-binding transport protein (Tim44 family) [Martelella mediterranea]